MILCSAAEVDYTESLCWYAERSSESANDFDVELNHALQQISADPERFPRCDNRHHFYLMRRFPFQIIYRITGNRIAVIAIAHSARSPDYWKGR
ncbi:MAG TPA: type II toxin-antitoxin system RelE/ParE family toxin [Planctomycetaceae bacterium]|nr:type II toxin-antitoxin system RelE/ParE family toxin [Planctomycetaceae bacterium]